MAFCRGRLRSGGFYFAAETDHVAFRYVVGVGVGVGVGGGVGRSF